MLFNFFIFTAMKNTINVLLISGAILVAWYIYQGKQFGKYVKARISSLRFDLTRTKQNLFTQIWFNLGLQISNPSQFAVKINAVSLEILYLGKKIGNVEVLGKTDLQPISENSIMLPVSIPTLSIFGTISQAIQAISAGRPIMLQLKGMISTSAGNIEVNENLRAI